MAGKKIKRPASPKIPASFSKSVANAETVCDSVTRAKWMERALHWHLCRSVKKKNLLLNYRNKKSHGLCVGPSKGVVKLCCSIVVLDTKYLCRVIMNRGSFSDCGGP